jgi:hypothetical protein
MSGQRSTSAVGQVSLQVGQPFNPRGLFNGILIPEALAKATGISAGAKMTYGRLTRYAGQNGVCFPAVPTLAAEIGIGERQTQRYLYELEKNQLIRRLARFSNGGQHSNAFQFLWHPIFIGGVTRMTPQGVSDPSPEGVTDLSPKESQSEESQLEEKADNKRISGCASQNQQSAASLTVTLLQEPENKTPKADPEQCTVTEPTGSMNKNPLEGWTPEELATVRSRIVQYWRREPEEGFEVSVMLRARGASATAVCKFLDRIFADKKLSPGGRWEPKHQNWFLTAVESEFTPGHLPESPAAPCKYQQSRDEATLHRGIDVIELPHATRSIVESVGCKHCGGEALVRFTDGSVHACGCEKKRSNTSLGRVTPASLSALLGDPRRAFGN